MNKKGIIKMLAFISIIMLLVACKNNSKQAIDDVITEENDIQVTDTAADTEASKDDNALTDDVVPKANEGDEANDTDEVDEYFQDEKISILFERYQGLASDNTDLGYYRAIIDTSGLNVRETASMEAGIMGKVYLGESYLIKDVVKDNEGKDWYMIDFPLINPESTGYISGDFCVLTDYGFNYYSHKMPFEIINAQIYRNNNFIMTSRHDQYDFNQNYKSICYTKEFTSFEDSSPYVRHYDEREILESKDDYLSNEDNGFIKQGRFYRHIEYMNNYENILEILVGMETNTNKEVQQYDRIKKMDFNENYIGYTTFNRELAVVNKSNEEVYSTENVDNFTVSDNYLMYDISDTIFVINLDTDIITEIAGKSIDDYYVYNDVLYYYDSIDNYLLEQQSYSLFEEMGMDKTIIHGVLYAKDLANDNNQELTRLLADAVVFDRTGAYYLKMENNQYALYTINNEGHEKIRELDIDPSKYITGMYLIDGLIYIKTGMDLDIPEEITVTKANGEPLVSKEEIFQDADISLLGEVSIEEKIFWSEYLEGYVRFLPAYESIESLSPRQKQDTAFICAMTYRERFYIESIEYLPLEDLERVYKSMFNEQLNTAPDISKADFKDGKYFPIGFSFHGRYIQDVRAILEKDDSITLLSDIYYVSEDDLSERYSSEEDIYEAIEKQKNQPKFMFTYLIEVKLRDKNDLNSSYVVSQKLCN